MLDAKEYPYWSFLEEQFNKYGILLDAVVKIFDNYNLRTPEEIHQIAANALKAVGWEDPFAVKKAKKEEEAA